MLTTLICALKVWPDSSGSCACWLWACGGADERGGSWSCTVDWAGSQAAARSNDKMTMKERKRLNVVPSSFRIALLYCNPTPCNTAQGVFSNRRMSLKEARGDGGGKLLS